MRDPVDSLKALFEPRSIAVIGASEDTAKTGGRALDYLTRFGFSGAIHAVNHRRDRVQGLPCHARIGDLPTGIDLAIIAVPDDAAIDAVDLRADARVELL